MLAAAAPVGCLLVSAVELPLLHDCSHHCKDSIVLSSYWATQKVLESPKKGCRFKILQGVLGASPCKFLQFLVFNIRKLDADEVSCRLSPTILVLGNFLQEAPHSRDSCSKEQLVAVNVAS